MSQRSLKNRIRVRSCGILIENGKLLLVELFSPVTKSWIWLPPGGEVEFGETLEEATAREFQEETGLIVSVQQRMYINQIIQPPIHAIEIYFLVERTGGKLSLGHDPELSDDDQIIRDIGFFGKNEIQNLNVGSQSLKNYLVSLTKG